MFAFAFSFGRAETNLLKAAIFLSLAVSCSACGGKGGASALLNAPEAVTAPSNSSVHHIFQVVMFENHGFSQIVGSCRAPYFNSLI